METFQETQLGRRAVLDAYLAVLPLDMATEVPGQEAVVPEPATTAPEPEPAEEPAEEPMEPMDVTIVVGTYSLNVTYYWLTMPLALGYWEDMGYNVSIEPGVFLSGILNKK